MSRRTDTIVEKLVELYEEWQQSADWLDEKSLPAKSDFAFLVAAIFDRGMPYQKAWALPDQLDQKLRSEGKGYLDPNSILSLNRRTLQRMLKELGARFPEEYSYGIKDAAKKVVDEYGGDAENLFDAYSALEVYHRLTAIYGIGPKIAGMVVRLLNDQFDADYYDIEYISLPGDRHNARVMYRLGLIENEDVETSRRVARELAGGNARKLDSTFDIGIGWCRPTNPSCDGGRKKNPCPMSRLCPRRGVVQ